MHKHILQLAKRSEAIYQPILFLFKKERKPIPGLKNTEWLSLLISIFLFFSLYLLVVFYLFTESLAISTILAFCASYAVTSLINYLPEREDKRKAEEIEQNLPPAIDLLVAQYRATGSMTDAIRLVGESQIKAINNCFGEAYAELKSGIGTGAVFEKMRSKKSRHLERVSSLIRLSIEKGADVSPELLHIAEDMIEEMHVRGRKKTIVSKDVFLLAVVFCAILPFIYALSVSVVELFSEISPSPANAQEIPVLNYLLLLSLPFNAYFVSLIAGELLKDRAQEGILYFPMAATASIAVFLLSSSLLSWMYGL